MNIVRKAILHACWQKENEHGKHAARSWLRSFLARVVGIEVIPFRKSERRQMAVERWLAVRKEAALMIDPETAEVRWEYGLTFDPYEINRFEDYEQWGRNYFARSPENDMWVSFHDLPDATRDHLWARCRAGDFCWDDGSEIEIEAAAARCT
jgi:hypothetical protein